MRFHKFIMICTLLIFNLAVAPIPDGWRTPTREESNQDWRNDKPDRYLSIKADFNGDGITDEAKLLMENNGSRMALFAFISQGNGIKSFQLDSLDSEYIASMGISIVGKGKYKTACGKGYFNCKPGEPEEIRITLPSIDFFKTESANSYFYWDTKTKQFKKIWISD